MMMLMPTMTKYVPHDIHIFHENSSVHLELTCLEIVVMVSGNEFKFAYYTTVHQMNVIIQY